MSLWDLQDKQTFEFMDVLYQYWLVKKETLHEAFRKAQHDMRVRYAKPFNPSLWAGFVLLE